MRTRRPLGGEHSDRARRCLLILVSGLWFVRAKPYGRRETQMHAGLPCGFGNLLCARSALLPARRTNALGVAVRVPGLWFARAVPLGRRATQTCVGVPQGYRDFGLRSFCTSVGGRPKSAWDCFVGLGAVVRVAPSRWRNNRTCVGLPGGSRNHGYAHGPAFLFSGLWFVRVLPLGRRGVQTTYVGLPCGFRDVGFFAFCPLVGGAPTYVGLLLGPGSWCMRVLPFGRWETQTYVRLPCGFRGCGLCAFCPLGGGRPKRLPLGPGNWFVRILLFGRRETQTYVGLPSGLRAFVLCAFCGGVPRRTCDCLLILGHGVGALALARSALWAAKDPKRTRDCGLGFRV